MEEVNNKRSWDVLAKMGSVTKRFCSFEHEIRASKKPVADMDLLKIQIDNQVEVGTQIAAEKAALLKLLTAARIELLKEADSVAELNETRMAALKSTRKLTEEFMSTSMDLEKWIPGAENAWYNHSVPLAEMEKFIFTMERELDKKRKVVYSMEEAGGALIQHVSEEDGEKVRGLIDNYKHQFHGLETLLCGIRKKYNLEFKNELTEQLDGMLLALEVIARQLRKRKAEEILEESELRREMKSYEDQFNGSRCAATRPSSSFLRSDMNEK